MPKQIVYLVVEAPDDGRPFETLAHVESYFTGLLEGTDLRVKAYTRPSDIARDLRAECGPFQSPWDEVIHPF